MRYMYIIGIRKDEINVIIDSMHNIGARLCSLGYILFI